MTDNSLPVLKTLSEENSFEVEDAVRSRYSEASRNAQPSLCCAVQYDQKYLDVLPRELIERDYGCGDPSRHLQRDQHVLDLGCGGGKICYIASQIVGPRGRVIGVDMNSEMLSLARQYQSEISHKIGWNNVTFHRGRIQDLALDLDQFEKYLAEHPIHSADDWLAAQSWASRMRATQPMIADESIDIVVSNCVLNLVRPEDRRELFSEIYRVLRDGGRAVISDIVCDEPVPAQLQQDPTLWSGCISGAFVEHEFLNAFQDAGFHGITILDYQRDPWTVVQGIEFRSMTVCAYKAARTTELDCGHAVIYRGPWHTVFDDEGNRLERGQRTAVSDTTFQRLGQQPFADQCIMISPAQEITAHEAKPFHAHGDNVIRSARETKSGITETKSAGSCCGETGCC